MTAQMKRYALCVAVAALALLAVKAPGPEAYERSRCVQYEYTCK